MEVDPVLSGELLDRPAARVGSRLIVGDDQLDGPATDAARFVDAVDRHLHPDERGLAAIGGNTGQRLLCAELVGFALAEGASPRPRQDRCAEPGRAPPQRAATGKFAAGMSGDAPIISTLAVRHDAFLPCSLP